MMSANPLARYKRLSKIRRMLLPRAMVFLVIASAAVAWLPFRKAIRISSTGLKRRSAATPEDVVWAVEAASRRVPWRTVCLQKGLAAQQMLRSAGFDAILHYGARHEPERRDLEAHVWVTIDNYAVIGGEEAGSFTRVATFP